MLVNYGKIGNKENQNPLLIVNQGELMKQEGIIHKNHFSQRSPNRYQNTVSCYQPSLVKCTSSRSLQEQIERIARKLKIQQQNQNAQQHLNLNKFSVDELVELLQNDRLLQIRQLQIQINSNKGKQKTNINLFPPLNKQNNPSFETTKSSEEETSGKQQQQQQKYYSNNFKPRTIGINSNKSKEKIHNMDIRKQRTNSQIVEGNLLTKKERINKALQNTEKIIQICGHLINEQITTEELKQLVKTEEFKLHFEFLIEKGSNNNQDSKNILQEFMIKQITKYKELKEAEQTHQQKREYFNQILQNYKIELEKNQI